MILLIISPLKICLFFCLSDLSHTSCQEVDDPLVRDGHHTLSVDLDDPVADPHSSPLRDASS